MLIWLADTKRCLEKNMGLMDILDPVSSIMDTVGSLFGLGYGVYQDQRDTAKQSEVDSRNFEESKRQYDQNFAETQRQYNQNFAYTKEQNNLTRQREDTAVQRRANDLASAGLNPLLAVGNAATTMSPIAAGSTGAAGHGVSGGSISRGQKIDSKLGILDNVLGVQKSRLMGEEINRVKAENKLLGMQADKVGVDIDNVRADTLWKQEQANKARSDIGFTNWNMSDRGSLGSSVLLNDARIGYIHDQQRKIQQDILQSIAQIEHIDEQTAREKLEYAVRNRDFEMLKKMGVLSNVNGDVAQILNAISAIFTSNVGKGAINDVKNAIDTIKDVDSKLDKNLSDKINSNSIPLFIQQDKFRKPASKEHGAGPML